MGHNNGGFVGQGVEGTIERLMVFGEVLGMHRGLTEESSREEFGQLK